MVRQIYSEAYSKIEALHSVIGQKRFDNILLVNLQFVVSEFGPHAVTGIHWLAFDIGSDKFCV